MKRKKEETTYYGGQAVMEGVMMRGKRIYAVSVRAPEGDIKTLKKDIKVTDEKYKILKLPVVRGVRMFVSSLLVGVKVLYDSAEMAGLDDLKDDNPSKFEAWLDKKFGDKLFDYVMYFSVALGVILSVGLFMLLPVWLSSFLTRFLEGKMWALGIIEGIVRVLIFLAYLLLVSRMKDIRRVFEYHGAEHKTINCYESGEELTPENVKKHARLHKRCGTSFLLIVMLVSMVVFFFVRFDSVWLRLLSRLLLVPVIAGISYEIIKWAGKSNSAAVRILSAPGLWLQNITTNEPDEQQIEVAIAALKSVLEEDAVAGNSND